MGRVDEHAANAAALPAFGRGEGADQAPVSNNVNKAMTAGAHRDRLRSEFLAIGEVSPRPMPALFTTNEAMIEPTRSARIAAGGYFMLALRAVGLDVGESASMPRRSMEFFADSSCERIFICGIAMDPPRSSSVCPGWTSTRSARASINSLLELRMSIQPKADASDRDYDIVIRDVHVFDGQEILSECSWDCAAGRSPHFRGAVSGRREIDAPADGSCPV